MKPKLSIIVPVYKVEPYLRRCIDSILEQSFEDFELLLVDDGSPDKCSEICDEYALKDGRIKVIHKENGGLSSARNAGIDIAQGEYIGFVDSDDYIDNKMYELLLRLMEENSADIAQGEFTRVYQEGEENVSDPYDEKVTVYDRRGALNNLFNDKYVSTVVAWNKVYRKSLFNDIRFPEGKLHEDEFTTYKLLYKVDKLIYINKPLYFYVQTPNSIIRSKFNVRRLDILEAAREKVEFFKRVNCEDLYNESLKQYGSYLINIYFQVGRDIDNSEEYKNGIRREFNVNFKSIITNPTVKFLSKILLYSYRISPSAYKLLNFIKNLFRK